MKKTVYNCSLLLLLLTLISSCGSSEKRFELMGTAQGTYYRLIFYNDELSVTRSEVDSLLDMFNYTASTYQQNSIISRVNANDTTELNEDFVYIFNQAQQVSAETNGDFDITVMPLVKAWGFHFEDRTRLNKAQVDSVLEFVGYEKIVLKNDSILKQDPRVQIDYNSIAQGYSVDLLAKYLDSKGLECYLIDVGGEMKAKGLKPNDDKWKVGIQKPEDSQVMTNQFQAKVTLHNKALATSGNYRKFFVENGVKYSHTINPHSGYPVQHSLLSVTVIADECSLADAYATAFMVMGLEKSKAFADKKKNLDAYFIYSDASGNFLVSFTEGFQDMLSD